MRLIDAATAKAIDERAAGEFGLDTTILMENAGLRSADYIEELLPPEENTRIAVVIGRGNNGGDGLVAARHLFNRGYRVRLFGLYPEEELSEAAARQLSITRALGIPCDLLCDGGDLMGFRIALLGSQMIVDAIFGSGLRGEIEGLPAEVIRLINEANRPVLALDIPSGVNSDSGECAADHIRADYTISFGLPKLGNILSPGGDEGGDLRIVDISFPPTLTAEGEDDAALIDEEWVLSKLHLRKPDSHKGIYGHVLVAGGSLTMGGSVLLAGRGALKAGAGLVTYMVPRCLHGLSVACTPEAMTCPLPETGEGSIAADAADLILQQTGNKVLVLGMGLTRHEDSLTLVKKIIDKINCPLVLDADALLALGDLEPPRKSSQPLILTPHPGEMARILQCSIREVQENRVHCVLEAAKRWNAVVVLKGNKTLIATPTGKLLVNLTGNAGMATGGMGDVLSGIIGAFLGQGHSALHAAALGVYFHGLAGDLGAEKTGEMGLTANDIPLYLTEVLADYENILRSC